MIEQEIDRLFIIALTKAIDQTDCECLPVEWRSSGLSNQGIATIVNYYGGVRIFIAKKNNKPVRKLKTYLSEADFKALKFNYNGLSLYVPFGSDIINCYSKKLLKEKALNLLASGYSKAKISEYLGIPRSSLHYLIKST